MNEEDFRKFLKRSGRSENAIKRIITFVSDFERYLQKDRGVKGLDEAKLEDLEAFVMWVEKESKTSAKFHLWGIRYYYESTSDEEMCSLASRLRQERIRRKPFPLRQFRGVNPEYLEKLADIGIKNVDEVLRAGRTLGEREDLAAKTGVPIEAILELVKLSDLARIPGIKSIRARLYYDAGVDTLEKMAEWNPRELREMLIEFVERTGFDGIAPLPKEAEFSVKKAKKLPKIVEY